MKEDDQKLVLGRKDKADFPKLGLYGIDAKIDTGAYTSAIHCHDIRVKLKGGRKIVYFNLLDPSHPSYDEKEFHLPVYAKKRIKNSFGQVEERYIIKTDIVLFGKSFEIELSLSDRSKMECPVLLGRKLLNKSFVVDVSKFNMSYRQKMKKIKKKKIKKRRKNEYSSSVPQ